MDPDEYARQNGFPDYATMKAWSMRRSEALRQNSTRTGPPLPAAAPPPRPMDQQPQSEGLFQKLMRVWTGAVG